MVLHKEESSKKEKSLKSLHEQELCNLENKHKKIVEELKQKSESSLSQQIQELNTKSLEEREKVALEKDEIIKATESERERVQKLYEETCSKVDRLSGLVQESEVGLGSASTRISRLNEMLKEKQAEITALNSDLTSARSFVKSIKVYHCLWLNFLCRKSSAF